MKSCRIRLFIGTTVAAVFAAHLVSAAEAPAAATDASPARTTDRVEFIIGPVYANAPELAVKEGVPRGTLHEFTMNSEESKIYPGIAKRQLGTVPYKRKVRVYVPKQSRTPDPAERTQADPRLARSQRERQRLQARRGLAAQL